MTHEPCIFVLFGATGDLTHRKLMPALYKLEEGGMLQKDSLIVAFARKEKTSKEYREEIKKSIKEYAKYKIEEKVWKKFSKRIHYHRSEFNDQSGYSSLKTLIKRLCHMDIKDCNKIFYLAVPPQFFEVIIKKIKRAHLVSKKNAWNRVVFEKPFGHNLRSARELNKVIKKVFSEKEIYRIDHYLGKELVQNVLVLRFANMMFEPIWNNKYIDHVQITAAEDVGVESRGGYYDKAGALRDMVQNHLMHLLTLTAMDPPKSLKADDIRGEKVRVLHSLHAFTSSQVKDIAVRGQYSAGTINGKKVKSYCQEKSIKKNSTTETFVALKLLIDNRRWKGVPFYLRTGKRLKEKVAEISIVFKKTKRQLFAGQAEALKPNQLVIRIQPEEGISMGFLTKVPARRIQIEPARMDFCHACTFGHNTPEAYERLLHDVMVGDQTLFTRWDEVKYAWKIVDTIDRVWDNNPKIYHYKPGSWGPKQADALLKKDNHAWSVPQKPIYSQLLQ